MKRELRILMLEDIPTDAELELHQLRQSDIACEMRRVENEQDFRRELSDYEPDLILSDFSLPAFDGLRALLIARSEYPNIPFIFVSGTIGEETAIASLKSGAADYILKTNPGRLPQAVIRAVREAEGQRIQREQEEKIARLSRIHAVLSGINSAVVRIRDRAELFREACRVAVEHGKFALAWVGVSQPNTNKLKPMAEYGDDAGYLGEIGLALEGTTEDTGIGGQALKLQRVIVSNDIEKDPRVAFKLAALSRGYRSLVALPLLVDGDVVAVLMIYARDINLFHQEELSLLEGLAGDVSFALEYIEKEERLNYLAYYDVLTGLPNRNLFNDRLRQAILRGKRNERKVAVAFIDLDHFKLINDALGHNAGDYMLKVVGKRLAACLRDGDTVARLGGDEFVMVLHEQSDEDATSSVLQRVVTSVSEVIPYGERELNTSCSVGIAFYPQDGDDAEDLLKHADAAMYRSKELGRNAIQFYAAEMNTKLNERLMMQGKLRYAVERKELFLHYQPQIDLRSGVVIGVEALARWNNPELGLVPAGKFIPIAEETDIILTVGEWVLRQACMQAKTWLDMKLPPITVSVNLSARQFRHANLPELVAAILADVGLEPRYLNLELTESAVMQNTTSAIETMMALDKLGVELSIDDFGIGYSSLSYLKRFPVSRLKIDQSFVRDIASDPDDAAITQAVISLGHSMGLKVIAEGVETVEQLAFLRERKCDEVQGYYFSRPISAVDIESMFIKSKSK